MSKSLPRVGLLVIAVLLMFISTIAALLQPPHPDPFHPVTWLDRVLYPNEVNAFTRLMATNADFLDLHVSSGGERIWAAGYGGIIAHSSDGGRSWEQQHPPTRNPVSMDSGTSMNQGASLLDGLIGPASAADAPVRSSSEMLKQQPVKLPSAPTTVEPVKKTPRQNTAEPVSNTRPDSKAGSLKPESPSLKSPSGQISSQQRDSGNAADKDVAPGSQNKVSGPVAERANRTLRSICFLDDDVHGWAVGDYGAVLSTRDGGESWDVQTSGTQAWLYSVQFIDARHGWTVGESGTVLTTRDGGENWVARTSGTRATLRSVRFTDAEHGWAVGDGGTVLTTRDGGVSWVAQVSGTQALLYSVRFIDADHGWAVGTSGTVLTSRDGGASWDARTSGTQASLYSVRFIDAERGWMVGEGGTVLTTRDGGASWDAQTSGTRAWLYSVRFIDAERGWAVGEGGTVLTTRDGGASWFDRTSGMRALVYSVQFIDNERGWVVIGGAVLTSRDGGASWDVQTSGTQVRLNSAQFIDAEHGWVVGDGGAVLTSRDGGASWDAQTSGTRAKLYSVRFIDAEHGWAVGEDGTVLTSRDGGASWEVQISGTQASLYSVRFIDANHGWAVGEDGTVLSTRDGGASWDSRISGTKAWLYSVEFTDADHGWAVGEDGTILSTRDGGASWVAQASGTQVLLYSVDFIDAEHGWAVGDGGTVLSTRDGGASWVALDSGTQAALVSVWFADAEHGWAVGESGTVLTTRDGGSVWKSPLTAYQRYPAGWCYVVMLFAALLLYQLSRKRHETGQQRESIADRLISDRPLSRNEPDILDLTAIADGLSRFIRNTRTEPPLTIAVTGAWGSGKSSLMNLLREDLVQRSYRPVWFNAWHHQKGENLLASLVANIRSQGVPPLIAWGSPGFRWQLLQMRGWRNWFKSAFMLVLLLVSAGFIWTMEDRGASIGRMLQSLQEFRFESLGLGAIAGVLLPLAALLKMIQAFGMNPVNLMNTMTEGMRRSKLAVNPGARYQFAREFADVTRALGDRKMVIFIDDLDRCQPEHVVEVLEVINYLMTSGRCFVILGMDPNYIETCVGLRFEELAEATAGNGNGNDNNKVEDRQSFARHYMEKLVNLRVRVPGLDDDKSKNILTHQPMQESRPGLLPIVGKFLKEQGSRLLIIGLLAAVVTGSWLAGDALHRWVHLPEDHGPGELHTTLTSITFLDEQRGFAVGENGTILLTDDGGKTWRANTGEQVRAPEEDTGAVASGEGVKPPEAGPTMPSPVEKAIHVYFVPGQSNAARWPQLAFPALAALVLIVGLFLWWQRPAVTEKDSPLFLRALQLWYPWIALRRRTPRLLKRYLNEVRYLAMQYRDPQPELSLWKRIAALINHRRDIPQALKQISADAGLNEAKIVALSAMYQLLPSLIEEEGVYREIISGRDVDALLKTELSGRVAGDTGNAYQEKQDAVVGRLVDAIEAHRNDPELGSQFPGIDDRRQFLDAYNGIRLKSGQNKGRETDAAAGAAAGVSES